MRKTVLVLTASTFFTLCSGLSLAYAGDDKESSPSATVVTTTTNHSESSEHAVPSTEEVNDDELVFDEETSLHEAIVRPGKKPIEPVTPSEATIIPTEPTTQEEYWKLSLMYKKQKMQLLKERNDILAVIAQNTGMTALLQAQKQKEREDEKKKKEEVKPMSAAAQSMYM